jgi:hypothetical protein
MCVPDRLPVAAAARPEPQQPRGVGPAVTRRRRKKPLARPAAGREPWRRKIRIDYAGADGAGIGRRQRDALVIVETGQPLGVIGIPPDDGVEQPEDRDSAAACHGVLPSSSSMT